MYRITRTIALTAVLALTLAASHTGMAAPDVPRDYAESVNKTIADNQEAGKLNVTMMQNVLCEILPTDPYHSYYPYFYGSGSGSAEVSGGVLRGVDRASFSAACWSPDHQAPFSLELTYRFQYYEGRGQWIDAGPVFVCTADAVPLGSMRLAAVQIPGTPGCGFDHAYAAGDPSVTRPHRLEVHLRTHMANEKPGPQISGWSLPWTLS